MNFLVQDIELPALIAFNGSEGSYQHIRPLKPEERAKISDALSLYLIIQPIMTMFGVADLNNKEFAKVSEALLSRDNRPNNTMLETNRVVFNYVAAANALLEHAQRTFALLCRDKKTETNIFREFCEKMKRDNDDFQFFCEFRNHAMHHTLPVGTLKETISISEGIGFSLTYSSASLMQSSRELKCCRLLKKQGTIDLKRQIEIFHALLNNEVLRVIVGAFLGPLKESNALFHRLASETSAAYPNHQAVMLTKRTLKGAEYEFTVSMIPGDIFQSLGIRLNDVRPGETE